MDLNLDGDDDEEILELKLAAIQAKLKLKKLQTAKAKKAQESDSQSIRPGSASIPDGALSSRVPSYADALRSGPPIRSQSQADVQIPASPVRRAHTSQEAISPSRVRLGIDKGLRAQDVSLKRAPSMKRATDTDKGPQGGYIRRTNTPAPGVTNQPPVRSFSERLAAARSDETSRLERLERIQRVRTKAFQLGKQEMEELKQNATEIPDIVEQEEQYSRDEVMAGRVLKRSSTLPNLKQQIKGENGLASGQETIEPQTQIRTYARKPNIQPSEVPEDEASAFEPYSSLHLSKRIIPHLTLTRNLAGKKTYVIPDLLKHVKAPEFQLPEVEQDIVVFGILASKSEPRAHKDTGSNVKEKLEAAPTKPKYMILKLVDLKWELELFLFNTGFERYWKLTPGTVLAILNPTIMPPPPNRTDTGRFSLVINSGQDTILEVGTARDLGFCKSVRKDGALCNSWVNSKRTEFCEFHMNLALSKKRLARQEVNAFDTGLGPKKQHNSYRLHKGEDHANDPGKKQRGNYDRETHSAWFMQKASPASMLDNEVLGGSHGRVAGTIERSEALRRRLATEEKERSLMKKLGEVGNGAGKEYMLTGQRSKNGTPNPVQFGSSFTSTTSAGQDARSQLSAKSLGLVPDKNNKIHLSPVKRKRVESALSSRNSSLLGPAAANGTSTSVGKVALGWGGGLKDKLSRMKEGEKLDLGNGTGGENGTQTNAGDKERTRSPVRKKTRFVTEKGIREAGRESLGGELAPAGGGVGGDQERGMVFLDDDDDDELVILK
jgi:minichromosome maintenance protein 10